MFKAFSDNLSSFISGGKTTEVDKDGESKTTGLAAESQENIETTDAASDDPDVSKQQGKSPPPRPNPPLKSASSISKQDTLPETEDTNEESKQEGDGSKAQSGSSDNGQAETTLETEESNTERKDKLDEVAGKAREWGSYLFSMTKTAGASVSAKAKELKKVVAENTIIGDFVKEQDKFVSEKKEKARASEAAVPPWVGYNEEEQMKTQMLALSGDKRNFLRNPPTGVQFHFDYETCYPVAMATLAEDDKLKDMRFKLVPKQVNEHDFWRNYFYRVSLIKQSTQLTSLAKQSAAGTASDTNSQTDTPVETPTEAGNKPAPTVSTDTDIADAGTEEVELTVGNDEFISDAYNLEISDEDLMREMEALRVSPGADEQEWEEELQKELNDYEVVSGEMDDAALEKEIMREIKEPSTE